MVLGVHGVPAAGAGQARQDGSRRPPRGLPTNIEVLRFSTTLHLAFTDVVVDGHLSLLNIPSLTCFQGIIADWED